MFDEIVYDMQFESCIFLNSRNLIKLEIEIISFEKSTNIFNSGVNFSWTKINWLNIPSILIVFACRIIICT